MQLMPRELWVHPLNELHEDKGKFYTLYPDLRHFPARFFRMYKMSMNKCDKLLAELSPELLKKDTDFRKTISPEQQLILTLR